MVQKWATVASWELDSAMEWADSAVRDPGSGLLAQSRFYETTTQDSLCQGAVTPNLSFVNEYNRLTAPNPCKLGDRE